MINIVGKIPNAKLSWAGETVREKVDKKIIVFKGLAPFESKPVQNRREDHKTEITENILARPTSLSE